MARKPANNPGMRREFVIHDRDREPLDLENPLDDSPPSRSSWEDDSPRDEILLLLAQIGQRLQKNEQERVTFKQSLSEYKRLMETLESRSEQSEKIFLTLQDKLDKQESAEENLRRRQDVLEQQAKEQAERMEKAIALADKIEDAMEQQARLHRRMDKIAQDKARFIRKLERIEESVTETQSALQSKAMVLLTDQGTAPPPLPARAETPAIAADPRPSDSGKSWRESLSGRAGLIVGGLVAIGILAGLGLATMQALKSAPEKTAMSSTDTQSVTETSSETDAKAPSSSSKSIDSAGLQPSPHVNETAPHAQSPAQDAAESAPSADKDALSMNDSERLNQLEQDPDALAVALNDIEPGTPSKAEPAKADKTQPPALPQHLDAAQTPPPPAAAEKTAPDAAAETKPAPPKQEAAPVAKPADEAFNAAAFIASQTPRGALADRIKPDPGLPSSAKDIEKQAFNGIPEAQHDLAAIYTSGRNGVAVDYAKAAAWFLESATHDIANAEYNLGVLYQQGLGVTKNVGLAFDWYRAAARHNHPEAQYNLGIAHIAGEGARYDPRLATRYFKRAAQQGVMEASYNLGLIYENGLLGQAQPNQALYWYRTAANQGSPEGKAAMNQLARGMGLTPDQMDKIYNDIKTTEKASGFDVPARDIPMKDQTLAPSEKHADAKSSAPVAEATPPAASLPVSKAQPSAAVDQGVVAQIQEQLMRLGLYPGPANGVANAQTEDAIRAYQRQSGLPQDGRAGEALLVNLLSRDLSSGGARKTASAPRKSSRPPVQTEALRPDDMATPETMQD